MPTGPDDPECDDYDPAWEREVTPFRRWLYEKLTASGFRRPLQERPALMGHDPETAGVDGPMA
ncbi:hypothetical protein AB0B15_43125 [Streptomyces sp. NPDC045456]|uniref:hypothetical protein n=1 Tax=Streptomyces sp. NPDC045456 TaxID=3155254 RepID=UPI0033EB25A4